MSKTKFAAFFASLFLLIAGTAMADTINFNTVVGSYGTNQTTIGGVHGIQITAYYYKNGVWQAGTLFGRNEAPDDVGVGICNPGEATNCGTGSGGGDYNEISDEVYPEVLRLTLPTGYTWNSVQLSSLDDNGGGAVEHGILYASSTGNPGAPGSIGTQICTFANAGTQTCVNTNSGDPENPVYNISTSFQNSQYLFLEARDFTNPSNTNNDFLLRAVTDTPTTTPEPGTLMLLGSGLLGLTGSVRGRFKK